MADVQGKTKYRINTNAVDSGGPVGYYTAGDGWTDQFAAQVDAALRALTWPESCAYFGVQKIVDQTTYLDYDPATHTFV